MNLGFENYPVSQVNAQKILGPPLAWKEGVPGEHTEVFISNLPKTVTLEDLHSLASRIGPVYMARLPVTYREAKGYAFVRFFTPEMAELAIKNLTGRSVYGRVISVKLSRDSRVLIVKEWPQWNRITSLIILRNRLLVPVEDVRVFTEVNNPDLYMGFILVLFQSHDDAARARRDIKHGVLQPITGKTHEVEDVRQDPEIPEETFKNINQLHIAGIPLNKGVDELKMALSSCLPLDLIKRIHFKFHPNEGYAFAMFPTHAEAEEASIKMRGKGVAMDSAKLRIHWVKGEYLERKKTQLTSRVMPSSHQPVPVPASIAAVAPASFSGPSTTPSLFRNPVPGPALFNTAPVASSGFGLFNAAIHRPARTIETERMFDSIVFGTAGLLLNEVTTRNRLSPEFIIAPPKPSRPSESLCFYLNNQAMPTDALCEQYETCCKHSYEKTSELLISNIERGPRPIVLTIGL